MTSRRSDNLYTLTTFQGRARIVDASYKDHSACGRGHDGRMVFSTKLKPSGYSKLVIVANLSG